MRTQQIQKAISDLDILRKILESSEDAIPSRVTRHANLIILGTATILSSLALTYEYFHSGISYLLKYSRNDTEIKLASIYSMAYILTVTLSTLYYIIWRAARHEEEDISKYIAKNFGYLKNLSLISDLLLKFTTVSLLIVSGNSQWVSPLLLLFIGDYLIQGRVFVMPLLSNMILGTLCIAGAGLQIYMGATNFILPLAVFSILCLISTFNVLLKKD